MYANQGKGININGLCLVKTIYARPISKIVYDFNKGKRVKVKFDIVLRVVSHKFSKYVGVEAQAYSFHFRKINRKDEKQFLLYEI